MILLRSHPQLCSPRGETQEVFKGRKDESLRVKLGKMLRYLPIRFREGYDIFSVGIWSQRKELKPSTQVAIDKILFKEKFLANGPGQNLYKTEGVPYTHQEIHDSRLLCKNLNGLIFLTPELIKMYPQAQFIGLTRNALAVIEGHIRRGHDLETFARNYEKGALQMIHDANQYQNFHLYRYEDLIDKPQENLEEIFKLLGLDIKDVPKVRLQVKKVIDTSGKHQMEAGRKFKELIWYDLDEYSQHFNLEANTNQINRLSDAQRSQIRKICQQSMEQLGY